MAEIPRILAPLSPTCFVISSEAESEVEKSLTVKLSNRSEEQ